MSHSHGEIDFRSVRRQIPPERFRVKTYFAKSSWLPCLLAGITTGIPAHAADRPAPGSFLTNVQQVLDLGADRARQTPHPVRLRGTVVLSSYNAISLFVQDETASILVYGTNAPAGLGAGKVVEVEGITESGLVAPLIERAGLKIVGEAPLPEGARFPVARMLAGEGCWQYVRVEGVVRDMNRDAANLAISIASGGRRFSAFIYGYNRVRRTGLPIEWLEARVVIDGVCWTDIGDQNRSTSFHLVIQDTNRIRFLSPGNTNLFTQPVLGPTEAARLRQPTDSRLKLGGTVLAQFSEDQVFLRTAFGPVRARINQPISRGSPRTELAPREPVPSLGPGDQVEFIGAPAASDFAPLLLDTEFRRARQEPPPAPTAVTARALTDGQHDADLVRITARLVARERRESSAAAEEILVLESGDSLFEASYRSDGTNAMPSWPLDARLQVDGICLVQPGPANLRRAFKVLLRGPGDVLNLGQTRFWQRPDAARALGAGATLVAVSGLWIWLLRRRVRERTSELATANRSLLHEVEEREKAQSKLKVALDTERELNELKSRFVAMVSHEFRTPLGITMSAVELLRNHLELLDATKRKELFDDIFNSTRHMAGLMEQVLVLGRVEAGKLAYRPVPMDLAALCDKLVDESLSATHRRCPIDLKIDGELGDAQGDESLLRHILSNLLSNAVKYSPAGQAVEFGVRRQGSQAVFTVRDRGIGIPEADLAKLFQPFHRASNVGETPGTGLGLVIVKRCVELHGGNIEVESKPGQGTAFIVRLPVFASPASPA